MEEDDGEPDEKIIDASSPTLTPLVRFRTGRPPYEGLLVRLALHIFLLVRGTKLTPNVCFFVGRCEDDRPRRRLAASLSHLGMGLPFFPGQSHPLIVPLDTAA